MHSIDLLDHQHTTLNRLPRLARKRIFSDTIDICVLEVDYISINYNQADFAYTTDVVLICDMRAALKTSKNATTMKLITVMIKKGYTSIIISG